MLSPSPGGEAMPTVSSRHVWGQLSGPERARVVEAVVRILTGEVEHDRRDQDPPDPPTAAGRRLPATVQPQASAPPPGECDQPASPPGAARRTRLAGPPD